MDFALGVKSQVWGWSPVEAGPGDLVFRPALPPVAGLSSVFNQVIARGSNSRRPHISQTQAGKLGTVTNSSSNQVKYVTASIRITPAMHSGQW